MKAGVSTASLFMRRKNEDAVQRLRELGVQCAEVFLTSFSEYGEEFARIVKEKKGDVCINSVHILNAQIEPQLFSNHERVKADSYYFLSKAMAGAKLLGAPYYTFHGTARYKKSARDPKNDNFERMGNGLREAFDFCQKYGVTLCLENVEWSTYNRVGVFSAMKNYVPRLLGVLDIKQARIAGEGYEKYLDEMGESLAYAHISDVDEMGNIRLPGQGTFDFATMIKRLKDVGFDGNLLIEVYKENYQDEAELKIACDYVNELIYKLG